MPQVTIRRPFGELDLSDQLRFEPHTVFHLFLGLSGHPDIPCFLLLDDPADELFLSAGLGANRILTNPVGLACRATADIVRYCVEQLA